ncbi:MAG: D-Ala-D-Ala carboxypeptidase family metallohydrolase [Hyphomicrobium sp.]|nr:D-Ala-D-Ala carboxypeptidase family metallohydrolase [Hyphomicrobium sp.]
MRNLLDARMGQVLSCAFLSFAFLAAIAAPRAEAKPTGWQSESELKTGGANAWAGYGDSGYVARPKAGRNAARNKSKALKAYGASYGKKIGKKSASKKAGKNYAALDTGAMIDTQPAKSLTGGGVRWVASSGCLNGMLIGVVQQVAANYGSVTVSSTCRSKSHNRKVGGAHKSHHLTGNAVDFRVHGNWRAAAAYLRGHGGIGGFKHYGGGLFHIDTGPRRTW